MAPCLASPILAFPRSSLSTYAIRRACKSKALPLLVPPIGVAPFLCTPSFNQYKSRGFRACHLLICAHLPHHNNGCSYDHHDEGENLHDEDHAHPQRDVILHQLRNGGHPHGGQHSHSHCHAKEGDATQNAVQRMILIVAAALGLTGLADALRDNFRLCCLSMAMLLFAAASPYVLHQQLGASVQTGLAFSAFPLVGICYPVALSTNILYKTVDTVWSIHGESTMEQPRSRARIVASLDSDAGKADGARKALEEAFQGKNSLAKKWEEEIRKRELSGGDGISGGGSGGGGGGGGGGWGGGGGGDEEEMGEGFGQDEPWDWEEFGQTFMATFALLLLYISITHGPKQVLKKFKLLFRYIRQGFRLRKIPEEYLTAEGSGIPSDDEEVDEDEEDDYEDGDVAAVDFIRERQVVLREADEKKDDADDDETEDDDEDNDDIPTPLVRQSRREDLLSKRQAEQKEKLLQLLTPKELRQQQEEKK